ncbi:hypothetical protein [Pectinatus frisingensis]|uniref:hypothetical protein n=1 Tax=Pectinatus frisingensis TaxID=865 RepID=UPI0018C5BBA5|nr:hypothetical protein [Pectinatus frisingensis]
MRIRKAAVVVFTIAMLSGSSLIAQAWWGELLYPGAYVFDAKRFADNVKETEQAIAAVQNTLENLNNRILMITGINSELKNVFKAVQGSGDMPTRKSAAELDTVFREVQGKADPDEPYEMLLYSSLESVNQDVANTAQKVFQNQQLRGTAQEEILQAGTAGLLGEKQKQNATVVLEALEGIDQAQIKGSKFMKQVTMQEAEYTANRIEREKARDGEFYGYDPYHPNEYDMQNRVVKTKSLGFMQYGE